MEDTKQQRWRMLREEMKHLFMDVALLSQPDTDCFLALDWKKKPDETVDERLEIQQEQPLAKRTDSKFLFKGSVHPNYRTLIFLLIVSPVLSSHAD